MFTPLVTPPPNATTNLNSEYYHYWISPRSNPGNASPGQGDMNNIFLEEVMEFLTKEAEDIRKNTR